MTTGNALNTTDTKQQILRILVEEINIEVDDAGTDLIDTGLLDSLTFVELLFQIEQSMGVQVDIEEIDLDDLRTVAKIAELVERQRGF